MFREKFTSIKNLRQIKNIGNEMENNDINENVFTNEDIEQANNLKEFAGLREAAFTISYMGREVLLMKFLTGLMRTV